MENRAIESQSEEVQEILAYSSNWILRWGVSLIMTILLLLLCASWFIRYPDVISSRITITNSSPPVSLVARSSGKLFLYVKEGDLVKSDRYLGAIENPATVQDVLSLKLKLGSFRTCLPDPDRCARFAFDKNLTIGELQGDYSGFLQCHMDYAFFLRARYHERKIATISTQVTLCQELANKLLSQKQILAKGAELALSKYSGDKVLFEKNLISRIELISSETAYLAQKYACENVESSIINNNLQLKEYEKTILDLNQQLVETRRTLFVSLQESFKKLLSQIVIWEQKYVLESPIDGRVSFFKFWADNQFVNGGNEIMIVVPAADSMIGRVFLSQAGAGKLRAGQMVNIELDNFPYREFGIVRGEVALISPVSRENRYSVTVRLPQGLHSTYKRSLEFKDEMQGNADIITDNMRLLERLFNQINSLLKNTS